MSVACEDVRELLPQYAEWGPRPAGPVEVHLTSCPRCSVELAAYRDMLASLASYRDREEPVPPGYLERTLALVPKAGRARGLLIEWREVPARMAATVRRRPAAASLTGAAIGVAAIGLVAWRRGRRILRDAARVPGLAPQ